MDPAGPEIRLVRPGWAATTAFYHISMSSGQYKEGISGKSNRDSLESPGIRASWGKSKDRLSGPSAAAAGRAIRELERVPNPQSVKIFIDPSWPLSPSPSRLASRASQALQSPSSSASGSGLAAAVNRGRCRRIRREGLVVHIVGGDHMQAFGHRAHLDAAVGRIVAGADPIRVAVVRDHHVEGAVGGGIEMAERGRLPPRRPHGPARRAPIRRASVCPRLGPRLPMRLRIPATRRRDR